MVGNDLALAPTERKKNCYLPLNYWKKIPREILCPKLISWTCPIVAWEAPFGKEMDKKMVNASQVGEATPVFPEGFTGMSLKHSLNADLQLTSAPKWASPLSR